MGINGQERIDASGKGKELSTASVNIEGRVVQRTEIGSARKCPNCGKDVQATDKFCPECGEKMG